MSRKQYIIFEDGAAARTASFDVDRGAGPNRFFSAYLDVKGLVGGPANLNAKFQEYDEASGKYYDITGAAFAQASGVGDERIEFNCNSEIIRCVITLSAGTWTFTIAAHTAPN